MAGEIKDVVERIARGEMTVEEGLVGIAGQLGSAPAERPAPTPADPGRQTGR